MPLLTEIRSHDLSAFSNLVSLSISGGKSFQKIHRGALTKHLPKLSQVRLENNWIGTLESDALPWEQLENLELGGNPWVCDDKIAWMIKADCIKGPVICEGPGHLRGHDLKTLNSEDLRREVPIIPMASIIISLLAIPVAIVCAVIVWRRRRFCPCAQHELQGRYVSVFTRDGDEDSEVRVDVRLRETASRIVAVSNGGADDTKHLVKFTSKDVGTNDAAYDTEEEEI
ncbi:reticulon-4 receptor-like 2 [Elysia marginata]|uniref:Reticulon-4 receptor-like 2 n=1 Tax=Elysia marginata TaxID=1093978 RepID=A0AAV4I9E6_9GAST|nr:reticulon-4 receptor-like 2 [Elysia marginata]